MQRTVRVESTNTMQLTDSAELQSRRDRLTPVRTSDNDIEQQNPPPDTKFKDSRPKQLSPTLMERWGKFMDTNIDDPFGPVCFWGFVISVCALIIITSTVAKSYYYVSYDQYALRINKYHGVDLSKVYTEGRYFLTLDNYMVYFPSTYKPVKFVSNTFSDNGLEFDLDISFYYKIPKDNLPQIYDLYSTSYENKIQSNAKQVTKNIASTFSVEEFLTNRSYIEKSIGIEIEKQIWQTLNIYAPHDYFKIISIDFPDILISKSLDTAIALQNNEIAVLQQSVNLIKADTTQMISSIKAESNRILQYSQTQSNLITSNANSESTNILLTARTDGLELFCSGLNITHPDQINRINKIFSIIDNTNNITILNTPNNFMLSV